MELLKFIETLKSAGLNAREMWDQASKRYDKNSVVAEIRKHFADFSAPVESAAPAATTAPAVTLNADSAREIANLCTIGGEAAKAADFISTGATVETVRAYFLDKARKAPATSVQTPSVSVDKDATDKFREFATDAMTLRSGVLNNGLKEKHVPKAEEVRSSGGLAMSFVDLARECLENAGVKVRGMWDKTQIIQRALGNSSGDFTNILSNVTNKIKTIAYKEATLTYRIWCGQSSISDFKIADVPQLSGIATAEEVPSGSAFGQLLAADRKEQVQLKVYGGKFTLDWQAMVNDDIGFFQRLPWMLTNSCLRKVNKLAYAQLTGTSTMSDTLALFHSTHANLGSTAAISNTTLGEMAKLLRKQKDAKNNVLNLAGKYFITSAAKEQLARQYLAEVAMSYNTGTNIDVYRGMYQIVIDAEIDGVTDTNYFLTASPTEIDTVTTFFLNGSDMPILEEFPSSSGEALGMTWRIYLPAAAKAIDWRGMVKNVGA